MENHILNIPARIVITGSNRGIGFGMARAFARAGVKVLLHARTEAAAKAAGARLVEAQDATADQLATVWGDLRDAELGPRIAAAGQALGGLDGLILSAAVLGPMTRIEDTDFDAFDDVMSINVTAQLRIFAALRDQLRANRAKVIWMTSGLGHFAVPAYGVYCASKHAVEGLARLAAVENEDALISVAVAPGMVVTEMLKDAQFGADVSMHTPVDAAGQGFVNLMAALDGSHNGAVLDIEPFLPGA